MPRVWVKTSSASKSLGQESAISKCASVVSLGLKQFVSCWNRAIAIRLDLIDYPLKFVKRNRIKSANSHNPSI